MHRAWSTPKVFARGSPFRRAATTVPCARPYLKEIDGTPLLSADGEGELARARGRRRRRARDHLIRANSAWWSTSPAATSGAAWLEDLIAEGNLGLIRAAEGFDAPVGVRFSTYASYWIKQSIRRGVMNQGRFVRLPAYTVALLAKWKRAATTLTERLGRAPSPEEVGRALRLSETKVRLALEASRPSGWRGAGIPRLGLDGRSSVAGGPRPFPGGGGDGVGRAGRDRRRLASWTPGKVRWCGCGSGWGPVSLSRSARWASGWG